jgi:hypothetical protein
MYMVIRLLIVLALLLPQAVYAACERYVSTGGSGIDCTIGDPCNIYVGIESASNGNEVCINAGAYSLTTDIDVPIGVSFKSTTGDANDVIIKPGKSFSTSEPVFNFKSESNTDGNHDVSYITFDGTEGSYRYYIVFETENRNNIRVHHNIFKEIYGANRAGLNFNGESDGSSLTHEDVIPAAMGASGVYSAWTDWPDNPATGIEIDYNQFIDCGYDGPGDGKSGAVNVWNLKDSSFHHNTGSNDNSMGEMLSGATRIGDGAAKLGCVDNFDIYNNDYAWGSDVYYFGEKGPDPDTPWMFEIWGLRNGCDVYNNTGSGTYGNWGFSLTYGKDLNIYDNIIYAYKGGANDPYARNYGVGIEVNGHSHLDVYGNLIAGFANNLTAGYKRSHLTGQVFTDINIYNNVSINPCFQGMWIKAWNDGNCKAGTVENVNVYNNTIIGHQGAWRSTRNTRGIRLTQDDDDGACSTAVLDSVTVEDNIVMSFDHGYMKDGDVTSATWNKNIAYDCTDNFENFSQGTNLTGDPEIVDPDNEDWPNYKTNYAITAGSAADGTASGNWGTDDIGVNFTTSATPIISDPDPFNGEILNAGTTSYNFVVTLSHPLPVTGCRMSDDDESYADMSDDDVMADNGDGTWDFNLTGLANDTSYTKYVACTDGTNAHSASNNFTTSFSVQSASSGTLLVDNSDGEYAETGTNWTGSTAVAGYYGDNYRTSAKSNETAVWTFTVPLAGIYRVDAQWTEAGNRPVNVDYAIVHSGGTAHIEIDQTQNGGSFQELGTWTFGTGETTVTLTVPLTGYACADAVRMVAVDTGEGEPNPAGSGSVTVNPAATGSVTFVP